MISDDVRTAYKRSKWALVLRGLLGLAVGVLIFVRPLASVGALALVIALWALVDGFTNIVRAFELRDVAPHWWVLLLAGVVSVLFGGAALYYYPALSLTFAVLWTTLWLITAGAMAVYVAIQERKIGVSWGWTMFLGLLTIAGGILAYMYPQVTLASLMGVIAAVAIISGVAMLMAAAKLQSVERQVKETLRGAARA